PAVEWSTLQVWGGALLLVLVLRAVLTMAYYRWSPAPADCRRWQISLDIVIGLMGAVWGALPLWLFVPESPVYQMFVAFAIAGMSAGAIATLSFRRSTALAYLLPMLLPLTARLALGPALNQAMAIAALLYLAAILTGALRIARNTEENIRARIESESAKLELEESRELLAKTLHIARMGSWEWDLTTNTVTWSDEVFRIFGAPPQAFQPTQETFAQAMHPDDLAIMAESYERGLAGERFFDEEWRIHTLDTGKLKYVQLLGERFFDSQGQMVRMVGTFQDITERKQAELAKTEFISTVSHELRTPLTSLYGSLKLLTEGKGAVSDGTPLLDIAVRNAERLIALVNDILDMARIGAGRLTIVRKPVDLRELVRSAVAMMEAYAERYQVRMVLVSSPDLPMIAVDAGRISQVVSNLLTNAAKFSPPGSKVEIHIEPCDRGARVTVADRGPGVPESFASQLFTRFARGDTTDTSSSGGTGLGLCISKGIVTAHGGQIGYEPRPGGGSLFYFEIPVVHGNMPS
ncbi:MAG: PAS domain-containing sensor histidine kinase, partial [Gammaproteobacteria bacterium]|nr:PAS domain-containing sensor histidine kinase [Gammaproteobacteria bacterium]